MIKKLFDNSIYLVVFVTGAAVLVIEILALRILSPYFGNTLYSTSSVIGIILGALSLGYYFGGRLSDMLPRKKVFYLIISVSGLLTMMVTTVSDHVLFYISDHFDLRFGALVSSIVLFVLPALLLGMISPYAIKLQSIKDNKSKIGSVSGKVFFFSTLGSIFGSLFTGFYLVPNYGVRESMVGASVVLVVIGSLGLFLKKANRILTISILALFISLYISYDNTGLIYGDNTVYLDDGLYERILVFDTVYNDKETRILLLDRSPASAKYLNSDELVYDYTKYIKLFDPADDEKLRVLVIGAGAYSVPKFLLDNYENIEIDVVDIESRLYVISKKYFGLYSDPRLNNHFTDARKFLNETDQKYDLILADAYYSYFSIPTHLTTYEFFKGVDGRLKDDGMLIANVIGRFSENKSFLLSEYKTMSKVFNNLYLLDIKELENNVLQNFVVVAYNDLSSNIPDEVNGIEVNVIAGDKLNLEDQIVLTDNYSPVEYMLLKDLDSLGNK